MAPRTSKVAIVDYSLGNLFSVKHACEHVGLDGFITHCKEEILSADAVILPGVGAFGDAMDNLRRLDLVSPLRDLAQSGKLLVGICLGQQLLMTESFEFGRHRGLDLFEGQVIRFTDPQGPQGALKVPQVGWNRIHRATRRGHADVWRGSPLEGIAEGEFMYFVHSFYVQPADPTVILSTTRYGHIDFCSSLRRGNIIAFQYHPERSGVHGMRIYQSLAAMIRTQTLTEEISHAA
jgi:glutamine amidotransferase